MEDACSSTRRRGEPVVPNGSIGFRWGEEGVGKWNLELGDVDPALTLLGRHDELVELDLARFDVGERERRRRSAPRRARRSASAAAS